MSSSPTAASSSRPTRRVAAAPSTAHNGEYEMAKDYARSLLDQFDLDSLDAIITNAAGCGSHLKHFEPPA